MAIKYTDILERATNASALKRLEVLKQLRPAATGTPDELADLDLRIDFLQQKVDDWSTDVEVLA